jgi:hypothetical protein
MGSPPRCDRPTARSRDPASRHARPGERRRGSRIVVVICVRRNLRATAMSHDGCIVPPKVRSSRLGESRRVLIDFRRKSKPQKPAPNRLFPLPGRLRFEKQLIFPDSLSDPGGIPLSMAIAADAGRVAAERPLPTARRTRQVRPASRHAPWSVVSSSPTAAFRRSPGKRER